MIKWRTTKFKIRATAWIASILLVRPLAVLISVITGTWTKIHSYCTNGTAKLIAVVGRLCVVANAKGPKIISPRKHRLAAVPCVAKVTPRSVVIRVIPAKLACITVAYSICNY